METKYGLRVRRADNWQQTVFTIARLYRWWQKPWDKHSSGKVLDTPPAPVVLTTRVPLVQRLANCLEGVGWERSAAIAARFPTAVDMIATTEADWELIPGIGKTLAKRIVRALSTRHGQGDDL
jgi:ERCC4-type nuclease